MTAEHSGSGNKFRVGDLYLTAYQTLYKRARFSGTLSWRNQWDPTSRNPNAPDLVAEVTIHRNFHASEPKNDWYELQLEGEDVAEPYSDVYPLEVKPFKPDGKWHGLEAKLGPPVPNPGHEDPFPSTWWLLFVPSYTFEVGLTATT